MDNKVIPIRKRTKHHKHSTCVYLDDERLRITFFALVIRVSSINDRYGTVKDFVRRNRLHGVTNGKILVISEMLAPGSFLIDLSRKLLPQIGMLYRRDFIILQERLIRGYGKRMDEFLNKEIPECRGVDWLGSEITYKGNYVWLM